MYIMLLRLLTMLLICTGMLSAEDGRDDSLSKISITNRDYSELSLSSRGLQVTQNIVNAVENNNSNSRQLFARAIKVERYLVYQPQFGLCNQLRALHHAVAIAKVLGRVLVIPDIIDNDGQGPIYKRDILFDSELVTKALTGVLKHDSSSIGCITQETYNKLVSEDKAFLPTKILDLHIQFKQLNPSNIYFDNLGWFLPRVVATSLHGYKETDWLEWDRADVEKVHDEDTLAISTTFGGWMGAVGQEDRLWHSKVEELVYQESKWITEFVRKITDTHHVLKDGFMCAHVRRGNFKKACERYDLEYRSNSSRSWVKSFAETGLACYVDEHVFIDQVDEVKRIAQERYKRDLPILLVTNDDRFADQVRAAEPGYNLLSVQQVSDMHGIFQPAVPVIEMTLCSKARVIIANQYSTYSRYSNPNPNPHPNPNPNPNLGPFSKKRSGKGSI